MNAFIGWLLPVISFLIFVLFFSDSILLVSTVGFGDITPKSTAAKMVMMLMIAGGFLIVSYQTGTLVKLLSERSGILFFSLSSSLIIYYRV